MAHSLDPELAWWDEENSGVRFASDLDEPTAESDVTEADPRAGCVPTARAPVVEPRPGRWTRLIRLLRSAHR